MWLSDKRSYSAGDFWSTIWPFKDSSISVQMENDKKCPQLKAGIKRMPQSFGNKCDQVDFISSQANDLFDKESSQSSTFIKEKDLKRPRLSSTDDYLTTSRYQQNPNLDYNLYVSSQNTESWPNHGVYSLNRVMALNTMPPPSKKTIAQDDHELCSDPRYLLNLVYRKQVTREISRRNCRTNIITPNSFRQNGVLHRTSPFPKRPPQLSIRDRLLEKQFSNSLHAMISSNRQSETCFGPVQTDSSPSNGNSLRLASPPSLQPNNQTTSHVVPTDKGLTNNPNNKTSLLNCRYPYDNSVSTTHTNRFLPLKSDDCINEMASLDDSYFSPDLLTYEASQHIHSTDEISTSPTRISDSPTCFTSKLVLNVNANHSSDNCLLLNRSSLQPDQPTYSSYAPKSQLNISTASYDAALVTLHSSYGIQPTLHKCGNSTSSVKLSGYLKERDRITTSADGLSSYYDLNKPSYKDNEKHPLETGFEESTSSSWISKTATTSSLDFENGYFDDTDECAVVDTALSTEYACVSPLYTQIESNHNDYPTMTDSLSKDRNPILDNLINDDHNDETGQQQQARNDGGSWRSSVYVLV